MIHTYEVNSCIQKMMFVLSYILLESKISEQFKLEELKKRSTRQVNKILNFFVFDSQNFQDRQL